MCLLFVCILYLQQIIDDITIMVSSGYFHYQFMFGLQRVLYTYISNSKVKYVCIICAISYMRMGQLNRKTKVR